MPDRMVLLPLSENVARSIGVAAKNRQNIVTRINTFLEFFFLIQPCSHSKQVYFKAYIPTNLGPEGFFRNRFENIEKTHTFWRCDDHRRPTFELGPDFFTPVDSAHQGAPFAPICSITRPVVGPVDPG
jgi:hypothetical protein